jgi:polyphosphate kinase
VTRFVRLPSPDGEDEADEFLALDDLIEHNLDRLFPGLEIEQIAAVPRDAVGRARR